MRDSLTPSEKFLRSVLHRAIGLKHDDPARYGGHVTLVSHRGTHDCWCRNRPHRDQPYRSEHRAVRGPLPLPYLYPRRDSPTAGRRSNRRRALPRVSLPRRRAPRPWGTGISRGISWKEIEVRRSPGGATDPACDGTGRGPGPRLSASTASPSACPIAATWLLPSSSPRIKVPSHGEEIETRSPAPASHTKTLRKHCPLVRFLCKFMTERGIRNQPPRDRNHDKVMYSQNVEALLRLPEP